MSSRDPKDWMWSQALEMLDQADRLHRQFFQSARIPGARPAWQPPADVLDAGEAVLVVVALPGVEPEQVQVAIQGSRLTVAGERPMPCEPQGAHILRLEIPYGRFERHIDLPSRMLELVRRELIHGCLVLAFRKLEER